MVGFFRKIKDFEIMGQLFIKISKYMFYDRSGIREWYFVSNKVGMSHENTKTLDKIFHWYECKSRNVTLQES